MAKGLLSLIGEVIIGIPVCALDAICGGWWRGKANDSLRRTTMHQLRGDGPRFRTNDERKKRSRIIQLTPGRPGERMNP